MLFQNGLLKVRSLVGTNGLSIVMKNAILKRPNCCQNTSGMKVSLGLLGVRI